MSFVDDTAINLGVPHPIVQRATRRLLALLREDAPESDMQTMIAAVPDLAALDCGSVQVSPFARFLHGMRRLASRGRATRISLQRSGLGDHDVAFVSAFATHLRDRLGESITSRLIRSVPGLEAMSAWPLQPHKASKATAHQESRDSARPKPPTMS